MWGNGEIFWIRINRLLSKSSKADKFVEPFPLSINANHSYVQFPEQHCTKIFYGNPHNFLPFEGLQSCCYHHAHYTQKTGKAKHVLPLHHISHHPQCAQTLGPHRNPSECETAPACRLHPALPLAALQSKGTLLASPITFAVRSHFKEENPFQIFQVNYSLLLCMLPCYSRSSSMAHCCKKPKSVINI